MASRWSKHEEDYLSKICGDVPGPRLAATYNKWATTNGFGKRSMRALLIRVHKNRLRTSATGAVLTTGAIANLLGIGGSRVEAWLRRYPDLPRKRYKNYYYIYRRDFREWARVNQKVLGGIPERNLLMVLEDEALAKEIARNYPNQLQGLESTARPVMRLDTRQVYPSLSAAGRANYVSYEAIRKGIVEGRPVVGIRWQFLNDADAAAYQARQSRKRQH